MKKAEVIKLIKEMEQDRGVIFTEKLDDGRKNERTIQVNRDNLIKILEEKFDDNLHGHFGDKVYTTILNMGYYLLTTTEV